MDHREANRVGHPSACNCVECVRRRLRARGSFDPRFTADGKVDRVFAPAKLVRGGLESDGTVHTSNYSELRSDAEREERPPVGVAFTIVFCMVVLLMLGVVAYYSVVGVRWLSANSGGVVASVSSASAEKYTDYKDNVVEKFVSWLTFGKGTVAEVQQGIKREVEEARARLEVVEQKRLEEVAEQKVPVEVKPVGVIEVLWSTSVDDYAVEFNQYRQSNGLYPLEFTDDLNRIAALRLPEIQISFSHDGIKKYRLAENLNMISFGPLSNRDALSSWKGSPSHNANMLDADYRFTGYANGRGYAVQVFSKYETVNGYPQLPPGWFWGN